jgi:hypothetical protein
MDYIKEAENYLKYYRHLNKSVESLEKEIIRLKYKDAPRIIKAVAMDESEIRSQLGKNDAMNDVYKLLTLTECQDDTKKSIKNIDDILDMISAEKGCGHYGFLLKFWYVDKMDKLDIAEELHISERSVYYHKENAIKSFAIALFGIAVLKVV